MFMCSRNELLLHVLYAFLDIFYPWEALFNAHWKRWLTNKFMIVKYIFIIKAPFTDMD